MSASRMGGEGPGQAPLTGGKMPGASSLRKSLKAVEQVEASLQTRAPAPARRLGPPTPGPRQGRAVLPSAPSAVKVGPEPTARL